MAQKRLSDKGRQVLRKGEGQRSNGSYYYRWTDQAGERHTIYSKSLTVLREREKELDLDKADGIKYEAMYVTINDVYKLWKDLKRGLKNNTFENYKYMYETFVAPTFGKERVNRIKKSDVKRFYNNLADVRGLKASTIDSVHTVLHQVFEMAVEDSYIRVNPSDNTLNELKRSHLYKTEKRRGLTVQEQELLLSFLKKAKYNHWYPVFAVLVGTGMRVGEATGLRWQDIDLEKGIIGRGTRRVMMPFLYMAIKSLYWSKGKTLKKLLWCGDDAIKPYFIAAGRALTLGNLRRQLADSLEDRPFPPLPETLQRRTYFAFGSAEDHFKYREAVRKAYPAGNFPVFAGYDHMQYQIRDPQGFAELLQSLMERDRLPDLPFLRK